MNDINEFDKIYKNIYATITAEEGIKQEKKAYILGGQPGCGKSTFFKTHPELIGFISVNGDEYRQFHPEYEKIVKEDIMSMPAKTQSFANAVVEKLIHDLSNNGYNLYIEGTLWSAEVPMKTCNELNSKGYETNLVVVGASAIESWKSTINRAKQMADVGTPPRTVPIDHFNNIIHNICNNLDEIQSTNCFDSISVIGRDGKILFPASGKEKASEALHQVLKEHEWTEKYPDLKKQYDSLTTKMQAINNPSKGAFSDKIKSNIERSHKIVQERKDISKGAVQKGFKRKNNAR